MFNEQNSVENFEKMTTDREIHDKELDTISVVIV